jgi:glycosyltransferase involved in cell wall biosynthesis
MRRRIAHVITSLDVGGANMMLYKLLGRMNHEQFEAAVIVLMESGKLGPRIEALGISVYALGAAQGRISLDTLRELRALIRRLDPELIQAWTYHSNVAVSLLAPFLPKIPVFWNIRHTPYDLKDYKRLTYLLIRYGKWLTWQPACIIYNSETSAKRHRQLGYRGKRTVIIPNGFDIEAFAPSEQARLNMRKLLGLSESALLIGMIARYHPMKDHDNFLKAAAELQFQKPDLHFVLAGTDVDPKNLELNQLIEAHRLGACVHLLGERSDIAWITAGLDIATLSSAWGDAFPNVIGEAMACGVPCVVTDIGDASCIVGNTGIVVPPRHPTALVKAWNKLLEMDATARTRLGEAARQRVIENYSLAKIARRYERLYLEETQRNGS